MSTTVNPGQLWTVCDRGKVELIRYRSVFNLNPGDKIRIIEGPKGPNEVWSGTDDNLYWMVELDLGNRHYLGFITGRSFSDDKILKLND